MKTQKTTRNDAISQSNKSAAKLKAHTPIEEEEEETADQGLN